MKSIATRLGRRHRGESRGRVRAAHLDHRLQDTGARDQRRDGGALAARQLSLRARATFTALADLAIPSQISFKFFDNGVKQARGKRISNFSLQKPIESDPNLLLDKLALWHEPCPPANRRGGGRVVSLKCSDHFLWFLVS